MESINPAMITLAREARGWTQRQLASAIGSTQSTVSKYEMSLLRVPDADRESISDALDFEPSLFVQATLPVGLGGDFLYRSRAHVPAKDKRRVQAEANILRMQLERLLVSAELPSFGFPAILPDEVDGNVELIAQEVRRAWRLAPGPIPNLTRVIESVGGVVFSLDFGTYLIDGTNIRLPGTPPMLFLNAACPGERHRYNIAHEVGHAVMHFSVAMDNPEEQANRFASEFLMPKSEIRSDLRNLDLVAAQRLKPVWGVSMAALIRRAFDLKLITESKYRRLFTSLSARGFRTVEPLPLPFEQPTAFERLKHFHRHELGYSAEEMRSLLFTSRLGAIPVRKLPKLRLQRGLFDESN